MLVPEVVGVIVVAEVVADDVAVTLAVVVPDMEAVVLMVVVCELLSVVVIVVLTHARNGPSRYELIISLINDTIVLQSRRA